MKKFIKLSLIPVLLAFATITLASCGKTPQPKPEPAPLPTPQHNQNTYLPSKDDKIAVEKYETSLPALSKDIDTLGDKFMSEKKAITIKFTNSLGKDSQAVMNKIIGDFKTKYPWITVENNSVEGGYVGLKDSVSKAIAAGTRPNIIIAYPDHIEKYNNNSQKPVLDLNPFVSSKYGFSKDEVNDFIEGFYREGQLYTNFGMYSLPFAKSTDAIYYNKDFFKANNLTMPANPSWDQIFALTVSIKEILSKQPNYQTGDTINKYPLTVDSGANLFISSAFQKNGPYTHLEFDKDTNKRIGVINFNNSDLDVPNKAFLSFFKTLLDQNLMITKQETTKFGSTYLVDGNSIMSIGSTGGAKYNDPNNKSTNGTKFEVGVVASPQFDPSNPFQIMQGPDLALLHDKKDPNKDFAAWLFMKYLTSTDVSANWAVSLGYSPVRKSSFDTQLYKDFLAKANPKSDEKLVQLTQKLYQTIKPESYFTTVAFPKSAKTREQVETVLHTLYTTPAYKSLSGEKLNEAIQKILDDTYLEIQKN